MDKATLRATYLEKRKFLTETEYNQRNEAIKDNFIATFSDRLDGAVHVFLPMLHQREVNTYGIISWLWEQKIPVATSITQMNSGTLSHYYFTKDTPLVENKWGIPEPVTENKVEPKELSLVLVPLIIFDTKGHRIGYGKGFYDRFLKDCPAALKVGLSLAPPLDYIPYVAPTDVPLDACISPLGVNVFSYGKI